MFELTVIKSSTIIITTSSKRLHTERYYTFYRFFDDGGTVVDIQSFNTQIGADGVPVSTTSGGRSIFTRNRPSKKSLPRSASQGPILQGQTNAPSLVVNNPLATQMNSTATRQPTPTTENNNDDDKNANNSH